MFRKYRKKSVNRKIGSPDPSDFPSIFRLEFPFLIEVSISDWRSNLINVRNQLSRGDQAQISTVPLASVPTDKEK